MAVTVENQPSAARPRLTIVAPTPPYPPLSGGAAHIGRMAEQLARFYQVTFAALAPDPQAVRWGSLASICAATHAFRRTPRRRWGWQPPAVRQEFSADLAAYAAAWAADPPDVVQIEFTTMAQYAPAARAAGSLVVCTAHNVAFLAQIRRARQERDSIRRARRWLGALSLWRYELSALPQFHLVVTHSQADAAALRRWLPRLAIEYVPSGIDLRSWPVCFDPRVEEQVLFVGNYLHPPNLEGAIWLAREVWPLVRRQRPSARLTLAGRDPPPAILALAAPDISVPGALEDLRPLYSGASLAVAPIFWGSGVRIKLLEALACGLPIATTALAAEGIDLRDGASALFAEAPGPFAAAIVRLLSDASLRARLGAAGRAIVERDYDADRVGARLAGLYGRRDRVRRGVGR